MSWIKENEIHRCDKPEYDAADPHKVGEYWQCDNERCNQIWYVATMGISTLYEDEARLIVKERVSFYGWMKVGPKEYRWP